MDRDPMVYRRWLRQAPVPGPPCRLRRLRRKAQHPALPCRARLSHHRRPGAELGRLDPRAQARRKISLQRPRRSAGDPRLRPSRDRRADRLGAADLRHLPRASAARPRARGPHRQDASGSPRCQPPGSGPEVRPRRDHLPEPWLRRAPGLAARKPGGDPHLALRRQPRRTAGEGPADLLGAVPPRGEPGAAGQPSAVRPIRKSDASIGGATMPKRTDIKSILILGAGPIVIGQACEFDYSGAQACKALKAEGYRVILVNSNPATIMTDPELADATYVEPLTPE